MKKSIKLSALLLAIMMVASFPLFARVAQASDESQNTELVSEENTEKDMSTNGKAIGSGIAIGLAGLGGAIGMGIAISKSADGISRQPEAESKIRTALMIGLVFIETVVIYALIVSILVIFVL